MKKVSQLVFPFFIHNNLGWVLVFANLTALYFFLWYLEGGLHNPIAIGCVDGKFTLISTFCYFRGELLGALTDMASGLIAMLNLPALSLSNFVSDIFFAGKPDCVLGVHSGWEYSFFYKARIGLNVLFIAVQWLIIGALIERLIKLVRESDNS